MIIYDTVEKVDINGKERENQTIDNGEKTRDIREGGEFHSILFNLKRPISIKQQLIILLSFTLPVNMKGRISFVNIKSSSGA